MRKAERRVPADAVALSCRIVSAYVAGNAVPPAQVPAVIADVYAALHGRRQAAPEPTAPRLLSSAQVRASLGPGGILSFETGKRYASLRRHLCSLGLSPDAYRLKWGLPPDYPMVCPSYSALRADIARSNGLGRAGVPPDGLEMSGRAAAG
ncbi:MULTISPECIES: MucR family transcriptional regulator [Methylobacterium]|jgi:predicted transcriptional regulator|uniref:MucR family transcriptional regulator n=1 Tax=Methylobacterium TaxID=407 RepID=UPI0008E3A00C|nr:MULTISPECIES: MucR family transcriptional regulator [Methylobacterium]MBZ6414782.1 MucR family transcriptional regulator [Methylobacterium sp.]MBK3397711.1 MucR family transcriptional regulator [Methylobacterium ajmalii]MBK3411684.1 MucR family transcriptional regulator [Methylobacterium ajmalii]MBK3425457.1 MucR family transcriptional regulator [Methylobacterium ajmalii]SFF76090.1 transcriptional regulator, MucR family [Methylobacterium sp. yr596]